MTAILPRARDGEVRARLLPLRRYCRVEVGMNIRAALLFPILVCAAMGSAWAQRATNPDLRIESLRVVGPVEASVQVEITVRNMGRTPAGPFATDAFMTTPRRYPLLFTLCPLTRAQ